MGKGGEARGLPCGSEVHDVGVILLSKEVVERKESFFPISRFIKLKVEMNYHFFPIFFPFFLLKNGKYNGLFLYMIKYMISVGFYGQKNPRIWYKNC